MDVKCPSCDERGCEDCRGVGSFELNECPYRKIIDGDIAEAMRLADLFLAGVPPVPGGSLAQDAWFIEFAGFYRSELERHKRDAERT